MKNRILQLSLCCIALLASITTINAQDALVVSERIQKAKPVMTFDKKYIDIGAVKKGETRTFSFTFTNTGKADLDIDLISTCECTDTNQDELRSKTFAPGESGILEVSFDSTEKEESEVVDIDIFLKQIDENTGGPMIEMLQYEFVLEK